MSDPIFRIHPSIGLARVGESKEFYLQPETSAGTISESGLAGGVPLKPCSKDPDSDQPITDSDLRDPNGALKRQAARFKIFRYSENTGKYPQGDSGEQVTVGCKLPDGRTVKDIVWTVHLANKKPNWFGVNDYVGIDIYNSDPTTRVFVGQPQQELLLRNPDNTPDSPELPRKEVGYPELEDLVAYLSTQRTNWVIDAGPRAIQGASAGPLAFDASTTPSHGNGGKIESVSDYPISFPFMYFDPDHRACPTGEITTLGDLQTDQFGRLIVLPAYGRACAVNGAQLVTFVDNADWFDDTADGPVSATLVLSDGSTLPVVGGWVVSTDPAFAPQIRNAVSLWDDTFDTFIRNLNLMPEVFSGLKKNKPPEFNPAYKPDFAADVQPFFKAASLQQWIANLPPKGVLAHAKVGKIAADTNPEKTELYGLGIIRNPSASDKEKQERTMPLSLGDAGQSFISPTLTQYFFLQQWDVSCLSKTAGTKLGPGEILDRAALENCLGGRFSPGIDITFICRDVNLYIQDWQGDSGPFRIDVKPLDYSTAQKGLPFLTVGYVPLQPKYGKVEPGDLCKFMAIPWHSDYNSCATHLPQPNPVPNNVLYWSWPAQRPVAVHVASDVKDTSEPPQQRFSVRGTGTPVDFVYQPVSETNPTPTPVPLLNNADVPIKEVWNEGRYQNATDMLVHWSEIGTVLQASQIEGLPKGIPQDWFLEAQSLLKGPEDPVQEWPSPTVPPSGLSQANL